MFLMKHKMEDYKINKNKELAKLVKENFEYSSGNNDHFLSVQEIRNHLINDKIIDANK